MNEHTAITMGGGWAGGSAAHVDSDMASQPEALPGISEGRRRLSELQAPLKIPTLLTVFKTSFPLTENGALKI